MKTVVDHREAGRVIWNPQFEDFAAEIGFIPKVCKVRRPQTKGKVERLVWYVKDNFFPGRQFEDIGDLNRHVLKWCQKVNSKRHSTTGKIPLQEMAAEPLLPLPEPSVLDRYRWETRKVTREGLVSFDGIRYGAPWQYSGKEVQVRLHDEFVEIYYGEVPLTKQEAKHGGSKIIFRCVTPDISTDEVVITNERIEHIRQRHPLDFERYQDYLSAMLSEPDYILETEKEMTAFILKEFSSDKLQFRLIMRLNTPADTQWYKNSIITYQYVNKKRVSTIDKEQNETLHPLQNMICCK